MILTVGSLFSGIGGIDLGLERTGEFKTIWFSEVDDYASAVLKKHWSNVPNYGDIKTIPWRKIRKPDVLCGGFPCQDVSIAGKGAGIKEGTRSGLWKEFAKAIRILRPRYALIENVPMLANRGLDIVLSDLAQIGYDAEWNIISASSVGAPHKRERLFIITYPNRLRYRRRNMKNLNNRKMMQKFRDEVFRIFLPTMGAREYKGSAKNRFKDSSNFHGAKMSEGLRNSETDPIYLNPSFAELAMGFPLDFTKIESNVLETRLFRKLRKQSEE